MGNIRNLMKGSGLQDSIEVVYARDSVEPMTSGKAIARTLRAHFLPESALTVLLMNMLQERKQIDFKMFKKYYDKSLADTLDNETFTI